MSDAVYYEVVTGKCHECGKTALCTHTAEDGEPTHMTLRLGEVYLCPECTRFYFGDTLSQRWYFEEAYFFSERKKPIAQTAADIP